jgi:hypothetical protein
MTVGLVYGESTVAARGGRCNVVENCAELLTS